MFLFENQVFQYQVVPFGFRNSLASFVRALQTVLGHEVSKFCVAFVDDIIIHSSSFEDHLQHLDIILKKLTVAGFTVNAQKCKLCQQRMTFLGHILGPGGISADPQSGSVVKILCAQEPGTVKTIPGHN